MIVGVEVSIDHITQTTLEMITGISDERKKFILKIYD